MTHPFEPSPAQKECIITSKTTVAVGTTGAARRTHQSVINDGITRAVKARGIDARKSRYKAMQAIAWQAFVESIEAGDFDGLVERAGANVDALPSGWEIKAPGKSTQKATAKRTAMAAWA